MSAEKCGTRPQQSSRLELVMELITFCTNMTIVRNDATESPLKYLMTSIKQHKLNTSFRKSWTFSSIDDDKNISESTKKMIETNICDPSISGASNDIVSEVTLDSCFDLDDLFYY